MPNLTILHKDIRTHKNLYSLNDLHIASGGHQNHKPVRFLRNQQTQNLIKEIEQHRSGFVEDKIQSANSHFAVNTQRGGRKSGTWACKELVYAYAMWISPKFHLNVIRAFDNMSANHSPQIPSPINSNDLSINDLIYELAKAKQTNPQSVHAHYNTVFNGTAWSQGKGIEHALAKQVLKQDLYNELKTQTPELQLLKQQAKQHEFALIDEQAYQGFQGRMQMQQQQIDKLVNDVMALSRNHNVLMNRTM